MACHPCAQQQLQQQDAQMAAVAGGYPFQQLATFVEIIMGLGLRYAELVLCLSMHA